jgi:hypothetical protein
MAVREERQKDCIDCEMRISEKSYISYTCNIPCKIFPTFRYNVISLENGRHFIRGDKQDYHICRERRGEFEIL